MLDRRFILEHADQVALNCQRRGSQADVVRFVALENQRKTRQAEVDDLSRQANEVSKSIGKAKDPAEREARKAEGRTLREQTAAAQAALDELVAEGRRGDAVEYFMVAGVGMPAAAVAPMRGSPFWPSLEAVAHTLAYDGRVMGYDDADHGLPVERWRAIEIPALVMDGDASPAWARNAVQAVTDALPNAERRSLPGQTHEVDPAVLAPVLVEFFG